MIGKYRQAKTKSRSTYYIVLSVVFVIVMLKWGVPGFINLISGPSKKQPVSTYQDNLPPQTPVISALPEATNSAKIVVNGFTEKTVDTELYLNDALTDTKKSDDNGAFSLQGSLEKGANRVIVKARDSAGLSSQSEVIMITFDDKAVELTIDSPKDGSEFFGGNNQTVDISGSVSKPEATVIVNGSYTFVGKDGKFNQRIQLSNGDNNLTISATDKAGNKVEKSLKLTFTP